MNRLLTTGLLLPATVFCFAAGLGAQPHERLDLSAVGRDPRWKIANRSVTVVDAKGRRALKLSEGDGMGVVWLDGYDFANGSIDVDLLGRSQPVQGSFPGIAFHVVDVKAHEAVYFRPFNFRASSPERRSHAVQYVSHPKWTWQILRLEQPGKYETAIVPELDGDEWFHARLVVKQPDVSVFINGATTPGLVIKELGGHRHGFVGLWVGEGSGGYFANLTVSRSQ